MKTKITKTLILLFSLFAFSSCAKGIYQKPEAHEKARKNLQTIKHSFENKLPPEKELIMWDMREDNDPETKISVFKYAVENLLPELRQKIGPQKYEMHFTKIMLSYSYQPESRVEFQNAFSSYIADLYSFCKKYGINLPRVRIDYPQNDHPSSEYGGLRAMAVYDVTKTFDVQCYFRGANGKEKKYRLKGNFHTNQAGRFEVVIENPEKNVFQVERKHLILYKINTDHLYNLLILPLEEPIQYLLGPYTDAAILNDLKRKAENIKVENTRNILDKWLTVEEAITGGLIHSIIRSYLAGQKFPLDQESIQKIFDAYRTIPQYRLRKKGIKAVSRIGVKKSLKIYREDPEKFRKLLLE